VGQSFPFHYIKLAELNEQTMGTSNTTSAFIIIFDCIIIGIHRKANCSREYWQESISTDDWLNQ